MMIIEGWELDRQACCDRVCFTCFSTYYFESIYASIWNLSSSSRASEHVKTIHFALNSETINTVKGY